MDILLKKYGILISKKIRDFNLLSDYDDVFQECSLLLFHSILKYNDQLYGFFSFFDRNLTNKLITIKNKKTKNPTILVDNIDILKESQSDFEGFSPDYRIFSGLDEKEKLLIDLYCLKKIPVKKIAEDYGLKPQEIYYIIRKAKSKIRENLGKDLT